MEMWLYSPTRSHRVWILVGFMGVCGGFPTVSRELHSGRERNFISVYQVIGLLVPVSYMHYCTSTSGLSTQ